MRTEAFFAETVYEVIQGKTPTQAMESVIKNSSERYGHILDLITSGLGGDSAARGMLIGMIVGAQTGMNGIPAGWFVGLRHHEELIGYINQTLHDHYYDYTIQESY